MKRHRCNKESVDFIAGVPVCADRCWVFAPDQKSGRAQRLASKRLVLRQYIQAKLDFDEDYHAISDAANDIREIDAVLRVLNDQEMK